jgi:hypothetical protein
MLLRPPLRHADAGYRAGRPLKAAGVIGAIGVAALFVILPLLNLSGHGPQEFKSPPLLDTSAKPGEPAAFSVSASETPSGVPTWIAPGPASDLRPILRMAVTYELEVGRTTSISIGMKGTAVVPEGSVFVLDNVPQGVTLSPATRLDNGAWSVRVADATELLARRHNADAFERRVEGRLLSRDGDVIAGVQTTLVGLVPRADPVIRPSAVSTALSVGAGGGELDTAQRPVAVPDAPAAYVSSRAQRAEAAASQSAPHSKHIDQSPSHVAINPVAVRRVTLQTQVMRKKVVGRPGRLARVVRALPQSRHQRQVAQPIRLVHAAFVWPGDTAPRRRGRP